MKLVCGLNLALLVLCSCTSAKSPDVRPVNMTSLAQENAHSFIGKVKLSSDSFSPAIDKPIIFSFAIAKPGNIIVKLWDADGGLIRKWPYIATVPLTESSIVWDGKDETGQPVPNDAYTFTVQDSKGEFLYNPFSSASGTRIDITKIGFRPEEQRIIYALPFACRMLVRAGTKPGPLLNNIVDWEPRHAGEVIEIWKGMDDTGRIFAPNLPNFILSLTGFGLPDSTVITHGSNQKALIAYRKAQPAIEKLQFTTPASPTSHPQYGRSLAELRSPKILVSTIDGTIPRDITLKSGDYLDLKIELADDPVGQRFAEGRFEIVFYVDNEPLIEEGQGYTPYRFRLKSDYLSVGPHLVVINLANFANQYGEFSFIVRKE